jgi:hypothetical protein
LVRTVIFGATLGEEHLKKELAETKDELQRLRGWPIRGMSTKKDLSAVSLVPKLAATEKSIPID